MSYYSRKSRPRSYIKAVKGQRLRPVISYVIGSPDEGTPLYFYFNDKEYRIVVPVTCRFPDRKDIFERLKAFVMHGVGPLCGVPGRRIAETLRRKVLRWVSQATNYIETNEKQSRLRISCQMWKIEADVSNIIGTYTMGADGMTVEPLYGGTPLSRRRVLVTRADGQAGTVNKKLPPAFVAWCLHYRKVPPFPVYHINGDWNDNRKSNLTLAQPGSRLPKGVSFFRPWAPKPWKLTVKGKHIGLYATKEEAVAEYCLC
jgi:NADH:ubiquinone oxidoreductase subunit